MEKNSFLKNAILVLLIAAPSIYSQEETSSHFTTYTVKLGDSLSKVLQEHEILPLYGKNGSIKKIIAINPELKKSKGNVLTPGQNIIIPVVTIERKVALSSPADRGDLKSAPSRDLSDEYHQAAFSLNSGFGFLEVKTKDNSGFNGLTSTQSYQRTQFQFEQYWDAGFITGFDLGHHSIKLSAPSNYQHSKNSFDVASFSASVKKAFESGSVLSASLAFSPIVYIGPTTNNTIQTYATQLMECHLGFEKTLMHYKKLHSQLKAGFLGVTPQKKQEIRFESGWGYTAGWSNTYRRDNWSFLGGLSYGRKELKTNLSQLVQTEVIILMGLNYDLY